LISSAWIKTFLLINFNKEANKSDKTIKKVWTQNCAQTQFHLEQERGIEPPYSAAWETEKDLYSSGILGFFELCLNRII
jgi:hypothetical protein